MKKIYKIEKYLFYYILINKKHIILSINQNSYQNYSKFYYTVLQK